MTRARVDIEGDRVFFRPVGSGKLWALGAVSLPLSKIHSVRTTGDVNSVWYGIRWAGTHVPRRVTAGWMGWPWKRAYWCVGRGRPVLVVDAPDLGVKRVVVSTDDPEGDAAALRQAVDRRA